MMARNRRDRPKKERRSLNQRVAALPEEATAQEAKPTAGKAIDALCKAGVLGETTGRQRDRVYAYRSYMKVLAEDTTIPFDRG